MLNNRGLAARVVACVVAIQVLVLVSMTVGASAAYAARRSSITGTVTDASSNGVLAGICVSLYTTSGVRTSDAAACTNSRGVYRLTVAKAGSFDVQFSDSSGVYLVQWYRNQPSQATANAVSVRSGRTTSHVDAALVGSPSPPPPPPPSAPTVSSVSPGSGPTTGGTTVTIGGTNLTGATAVTFGSTPATAFTVTGASAITATAPAGVAGTVDVTVTTGGGTSATSAADQFTYQAPPPPPPSAPTITAIGSLLTHTNQPSRAQEQISVSPSAVGDVLTLAVETKFPSGVPAFGASAVTGGGVTTWTRASAFLTLDGSHEAELWWGTVTAAGPATITVTYTAGSTSGNSESATSLDVQEFRSSAGASTVWTLDAVGKVDTGVAATAPYYPTLTPSATNELYFGYLAVPASVGTGPTPGVVYSTDARGNQCAYDVSVSATITPTASSKSQTFISIGMLLQASAGSPPPPPPPPPSAPTVSSVSPGSGPTTGGTTVTIGGTNLTGATAVTFGSTPATAFTVTGASAITATAPAGVAGTVDVTVTTGGGTSATSAADQFTYQAPPPPPPSAPTITAIGSLLTHTNQPSRAQEQISVSPSAVGDVLTLAVETKFPSGVPAFGASAVTGGGVTTWTRASAFLTLDGSHEAELWWGTVTAAGPATITVTYTAGSTSGNSESATSLDVQEFRSSAGASTVWTLDAVGKVDTGVAATAPYYPTLTPSATNELYFGYLAVPASVGTGPTPGVVYSTDARGNQCAYDVSVSATITPTASSKSQTFISIGMLLQAS